MPKFTSVDDANLIEYLAEPNRLLSNPKSLSTYFDLGPRLIYTWSHQHKPDAWLRRAGQIENLSEKMLLAARDSIKERTPKSKSASPKSRIASTPQTKTKKSAPVVTKKPTAVEKAQLQIPFFQEDARRLAAKYNVELPGVRDLIRGHRSVCVAEEMIRAELGIDISDDDDYGDFVADDEDDGDSEEEGEECVNRPMPQLKPTKLPIVVEDDDDDDEEAGAGYEQLALQKVRNKIVVSKPKKTVLANTKYSAKRKYVEVEDANQQVEYVQKQKKVKKEATPKHRASVGGNIQSQRRSASTKSISYSSCVVFHRG
ncbi:hypothetical protein R3P38DRAFT_2850689 [Favolaschia claudopus]|uniref:Uncharacterized protein n=1 Tax=Favolaschia claudopus TaxID=2862362 RepID=A0AAW0DNY0_9AGAR